MEEADKKIVEQMIKEAVKAALDFKSRKVGDTPTDANQLTPLKFVNTKSVSTPGGQSITGAATISGGTNIYVSQSGSIITINQSVAGAAVADIQIFMIPSTLAWIKPSGAKMVEVYCIGGGGGGAGGDLFTLGGYGGAGGGWAYKKVGASILSNAETVVVGYGGVGGDNSGGSGNRDGSVGGMSMFGNASICVAPGGTGGKRGTSSLVAVGVQGFGDITYLSGDGGGGNTDTANNPSPRGGGNGGLATSGGSGNGGNGGSFTTNYIKTGGSGGAECLGTGCTAQNGSDGVRTDEYLFIGGVGGGGGGAGQNLPSTVGGNGGAGGFPGGGGGGGGFGVQTHGNGGNGGGGLVGVITYF